MNEETPEECETVVTEEATTVPDLDIELPDDPEAAISVLKAEVVKARELANSHLDDLRRVAAEFDNFRKRASRDLGVSTFRGAEKVVRHLLPTLDTFDAALNVETTSPTEEKLLGGLRNTHTQLLDTLAGEGLEVIDSTPGTSFDPEIHEAVMTTPGDDLVITQELRRGYRLGGRVVRAALVALGPGGDRRELGGDETGPEEGEER